MITFLHTSSTHIQRFEKLVRKYANNIVTKHFVNEDLLQYAQVNEELDLVGFEKEILEIKKSPVELIICTCSTYGAVCKNFENVFRIDQPIADYLVSRYTTIGLVFTVGSTKEVSQQLLIQTAYLQNKRIEIIEFDCTDSWQYFERGNLELYEKNIAKRIKKYQSKVDAIFLAQASMEGAKDYLKELEIEICSSPEFGMKTFLKKIKNKKLD